MNVSTRRSSREVSGEDDSFQNGLPSTMAENNADRWEYLKFWESGEHLSEKVEIHSFLSTPLAYFTDRIPLE